MTGIGIVGCGFVADYYLSTLEHYPELKVIGVFDKDKKRSSRFAQHYGLVEVETLEALLSDPKVEIILNLTNPRNHFEISKLALEAGKHVYSEKPLAMCMKEAQALYDLANKLQRRIASAPCSFLGESAQTLWKAIREDVVGSVQLVYGEMDDGPIYLMHPENWRSQSGTPWPAKDEYEVGCTFEHAGYYLNWFIPFFGPAESVTVASHQVVQDKRLPEVLDPADTPDFSVACIKFASGTIARLTCSITAPHDHSIKVVGEKGVLSVEECWHYADPVRFKPFSSIAFRAAQYGFIRNNPLLRPFFGLNARKLPFVKKPGFKKKFIRNYMDYARGVAELASSIREDRICRLSPELALHINEIVGAIHEASKTGGMHIMKTSCPPIEPMDWAK